MKTLNEYLAAAGVSRPLSFGDYVNLRIGESRQEDPRPYQITGLNLGLKHQWFGLWDDPGTGKTVVSQAWAIFWVSEGYKTLAITLANLVGQYYDDFLETFEGITKYVQIARHDKPKAERQALEAEWEVTGCPDVLILSYEGFNTLVADKGIEWLHAKKYLAAVADEVHKKFTNVDTNYHRTITAWRDGKRLNPVTGEYEGRALPPPHNITAFMPMTGTPIKKDLTSAYGIIELANPGEYANNDHFLREHCLRALTPFYKKGDLGKPTGKAWKTVGFKNHAKVNAALFKRGRRVVKDKVLPLDKPNIRRLKVELSREHRALYKELLMSRFLQMGDEVLIATNQQRLRQYALQLITYPERFIEGKPELGKGPLKNNVLEAVEMWLEEADLEEQKVILFFNLRASVQAYGKHFAKYNPAFMYGGVTGPRRDRERYKVLRDDSCRLLIANTLSASAGLNLQHVSHNVLFVEPTGIFGDFKQGLERVDRSGQKHVVDVGVVDVLGTISRRVIDTMVSREREIEKVVLDKRDLLNELGLN